MIPPSEIRELVLQEVLQDPEAQLGDEDSFLESGLFDSTAVLTLVEALENKYGIKIEDDELLPENLDSISLICQFLDRKLSARGAAT